jgi:hypothetical protein
MNTESELSGSKLFKNTHTAFYQTFTLRLSANPEPLSFIKVVMILPPNGSY